MSRDAWWNNVERNPYTFFPCRIRFIRDNAEPCSWDYVDHGNRRGEKFLSAVLKLGVTKWMRENSPIHDVWQRNYYEHVIRDEADLNRIREYISTNPARWAEDDENPSKRDSRGAVRNRPYRSGIERHHV